MNLGTNLWGKFALFSISVFLVGCNDLKENDVNADDSKKLSVEFSQSEVSIPIGGSLDLLVNISPANRADEVTFYVAEETVVSLDKQTPCEEGVMLHLSSHKLSSTTVYAFHEDLAETPECVITVAPIGLESIALDKETLSLKVFESATLSAKLTPENVTNPVLIWKSDNEEVVTVDNGVVTAHKTGEALVTVSFDGKSASCKVVVTAIPAESVTLWFDKQQVTEKVISEGERFRIDATILPEEVTYKTISEWSVSDPEILSCEAVYIDGNSLSAYITGKSAGKAKVYAKIELGAGGQPLVATCDVTVKALAPPLDPPKIGDYFYSDGTWSDGGLVSINSDGTQVEWAEEIPAPIEGKTVIGIVFQTDPRRFSKSETEAGYNRGLVFCLKSAHGPKKNTTLYAMDDGEMDFLSSCIWGSSWYANLNGYEDNRSVISKFSDRMARVPAFDFVHTDFSPAAPANTSGWFIPSIGQLWDFVANLGGTGVAERLATFRTYDLPMGDYRDKDTYQYGQVYIGYNVMDVINARWAKVPAEQKDDLVVTEMSTLGNTCRLMSSTCCRKEETCCTIELGDNDCIYMTPEWFSCDFTCHPILAF